VVLVFSDVTEKYQAQEVLRQSQDKYRRLFEDAAIGVFRSNFQDRFIEVNPALAHMLGYDSPEEVVGAIHSISEQVYAEPPQRTEIITNALASGKAVVAENRYRRKDGTVWIGNLVLRYVNDAHGQPQYLEGFVEDITERKQAEALVHEGEKRLASEQAAALEVQRQAAAVALSLMEDAIAARNQVEVVSATLAEQLDELRRWQQVMFDRESRILSVKKEINDLLADQGQPPRYPSALDEGAEK